ncbi:MAG: pilus assembly protein PilP [Candidatus Binatia bacterium]
MSKQRPISLLISIAWVALFAGRAFSAEEAIRTPSGQMKEAVNKLGKAPATIGKSLQDLTDSAKEKLREAFGSKAKADATAEPVDFNLPKKLPVRPAAPVDIRNDGARDPFRPMTLPTKVDSRPRENLSPLERLELSQLKLVGIVWDIKEPRAMVEDTAGLGYIIKVGTPIGSKDGKVRAIHRNEVVVEEFYSDAYGVRRKHDVGIKLLAE